METKVEFDGEKLTVTRTFEAPRESVFDAWIEASKVELWWGCGQTTKTESQVEPRVGGKYVHNMHLEGVGEFEIVGVIKEFDPPARLVYEATDRRREGPATTVQVDFVAEDEGRTRVTLVQDHLEPEFIEYVKDGWRAAFGKLGKFLLSEAA
ncbi:MAG: SRPBCC domain-containing protein [Acidobacteriota bacterium]